MNMRHQVNLFCFGIGLLTIVGGVALAIMAIWGSFEGETIARLFGTDAVIFAGAMFILAANALAGPRPTLLSSIFHAANVLCIIAAMILSLVMIWADIDNDTTWKALATVGVLFLASLLTLAIMQIFNRHESDMAVQGKNTSG